MLSDSLSSDPTRPARRRVAAARVAFNAFVFKPVVEVDALKRVT